MVCFSAVFAAGQVVAVDRRADVPERVAQPRAELAVVLAVLQTLTMRFERGCMRSHVISTSRTPNLNTMALSVEHFSADATRRPTATFTAVDDLSFEVARGRNRRPHRPERRRQDHDAAVAGRHSGRPAGPRPIDGHDLVADALEAKRRLAFMPDEPHLFEYLTVEEHLRLMARLYSVRDFEPRAARSSTSWS